MDTKKCQQVQQWIRQIDHSGEPDLPPTDLVAHVVGCANCRSLLLLLTARMLPGLSATSAHSHQACQDDLAAYIDATRDHGSARAVQSYPHVWWHLSTCADCRETYELTVALLKAEDQGLISTLPRPARRAAPQELPTRTIGTFRVARRFINQVLNPLEQLGAAMGDDDEPTILGERRAEQHRMILSVQQQPGAIWEVHVTIVPPIRGYATVRLGETAFRMALNAASEARFPIRPLELLTDSDGPDLLVEIELDERALPVV